MRYSGWLTEAGAKELWPEAEGLDPKLLSMLVSAAAQQCDEYLGDRVDPSAPNSLAWGEGYRLAHLMQIKALWNAQSAGQGDLIGPEGQVVRVYPMDRQVRALLRPARRKLAMF